MTHSSIWPVQTQGGWRVNRVSSEGFGDWQELEVLPMAMIGFLQPMEELSEGLQYPDRSTGLCPRCLIVYNVYHV
jgi:hypothetical protein